MQHCKQRIKNTLTQARPKLHKATLVETIRSKPTAAKLAFDVLIYLRKVERLSRTKSERVQQLGYRDNNLDIVTKTLITTSSSDLCEEHWNVGDIS